MPAAIVVARLLTQFDRLLAQQIETHFRAEAPVRSSILKQLLHFFLVQIEAFALQVRSVIAAVEDALVWRNTNPF